MELTPYQRDILIRTVLGEARGEGSDGMAAVAQVILNRANSGQFDADPAAVALQPSQFSTWNSGAGGNNPQQFTPSSNIYQSAGQIVDQVAGGQIPDRTNGALYYHTPQVSPNWSNSVNQYGTTQLGNHIFYNGRPTPPGEIPNTVASLTDTVQPGKSAPTPHTMSNALSQERGLISSTAPNALKSALARLASSAAREKNAPVPASEWDRVTARNKAAGIISKSGTPTLLPPIGPTGNGSQVVYRDITPAQEMKYLYQNGGPTRPGMNVQPLGSTAGFATGPAGSYPGGPMVPGAAGSINLFKDQSQLPANQYPAAPGTGQLTPIQQLAALYSQGGPTRPGMNVPAQAQALAPTPFPRPQGMLGGVNISKGALGTGQRAPVPLNRPPGLAGALGSSRPPLEILVQGSNTIQPPQMSVVNALRLQGLSPAQAYALANANNTPRTAADRDQGYDGPGNVGISGLK